MKLLFKLAPVFLVGSLLGQTIENRFVKREFSTNNNFLKTTAITNKLAKTTVKPVSSAEFSLRVSEGTDKIGTDVVLTAKDFKLVTNSQNSSNGDTEQIFLLKNKKHSLSVLVRFELKKEDRFIRKTLEITTEKAICIERIDIDSLELNSVTQPYQHKAITAVAPWNWKPGLGQPLYANKAALFLGTEFPASFNYVENNHYYCGYQYGHILKPNQKLTTYPAVMGVSDHAKYLDDAFYAYINQIRIRPLRLQVQYNSWFDFHSSVTKDSFIKCVNKINDELCIKRDVSPLKAYVIDDGWQASHSDWEKMVWPVNQKFNPEFKESFAAVKAAKSKLGLWMSPGCNFGARPAVPHMRKKGWGGLNTYMSLANTKYMDMLDQRMTSLAGKGVNYFKLDGLFGHLNNREFDLKKSNNGVPHMPQLNINEIESNSKVLNDSKYDEAKIYYLTVGAERLMKIFANMSKANPDVYIVISNGAWLSPWWLMHCDSVWMINAGDAARGSGRTGELVYRDSVYHNIWVKEQTKYPMNSLFNHEPKKTSSKETKDTFRKYLYMNMSRGTGFIELYTKTFKLNDYDWDVMAEGLHWAEDVFPTFTRSRMHGGAPKKGEVYGYTAWTDKRGYVSLHNPSNKTQTYRFTLNRDFGLIPGEANYALTSPMADSLIGLKESYSYNETITIELKPQEIRILNFDPKPRSWKKLKALQTRTKADFKPISLKGHKAIGRWYYKHGSGNYSREFTKKGFCILRQDNKEIWRDKVEVIDESTVMTKGEKHVIQKNGTMKMNRYIMKK